ncbi:ComEA family DNA-binding protein [Penaeicola halotolerans]|uniref:ComEA family DNA-binding protein n=1 Tax=Penaeicola halotolerans TaxID=2793196 RepID=UPI001CF8F2A4|nr:helix-hairpin-helix domain-containing protein [Penaeicola halotolerans]
MKRIQTIWLIILLLLGYQSIHAQTYPKKDIDIEAFVEEFFALQDEELNYEDLYENLLLLYANPINLNNTTADELKSIYILSPLQINSLLEHIQTKGKLLSIYELQAIPNFDINTIYRLLPFVTVTDNIGDNRPLWKKIQTEKSAYFMLRHARTWETRRGYTPPDTLSGGRLSSRYLGSPDQVFARLRISHPKDYSLGFTVEKDPGEQFIWEPSTSRYGFDFYSGHFYLQNRGKLKSLAIGDYQVQFGQGLIFGAGFGVGKGSETIATVRRSNLGLRPYTSVLEVNFMRGAAATYQLSPTVEITGLYSLAERDGSLQAALDTLDNVSDVTTSLQLSGFHRTPTELANKNQVTEQNIGANITYKSTDKNLQIGTNFLQTSYSAFFDRPLRNYNQFDFRGNENYNAGAFVNYNLQNFFLFSEVAQSKSGGRGAIAGLMASLSYNVDLAIVWRDYDRDFHSFYGNGFGENTRNANERGIYWGIKYRPSRKFGINAYYDRFRFPWMRFRAYAPSEGHEYLIRLDYSPSRDIRLFAQVREESKARNISEQSNNAFQLDQGIRRNFVLNLDVNSSLRFSFKSRIQFSTFDFNGQQTNGFVILQDVNFQAGNRLKLSTRFALFDAGDFDNRQYVYEKNVLYAFSIPAYFGQGVRTYLLLQYQVNSSLTLYGRIAQTRYTDRNVIGSGLQTIEGNTLTDSHLQLRYYLFR